MLLAASLSASAAHAQSGAPALFSSPENAVDALVTAVQDSNLPALHRIFGDNGRELLSSGDPVQDRKGRQRFLYLYREKNTIEAQGDKMLLLVGNEQWPFPAPIIKTQQGWLFDAAAGKEEVLNRRIGGNELAAIDTCREYVQAQRSYFSLDRDNDGFREYARYFVSAPGRRDGLFWVRRPGEEHSPLGPLALKAFNEGYFSELSRNGLNSPQQAFHGYYFRILKAQGAAAKGGSRNYIEESGRMTGGFALTAYPAAWGTSGIMTFIVNQDGLLYQKNLGPRTIRLASAMREFNPDSSWRLVEQE